MPSARMRSRVASSRNTAPGLALVPGWRRMQGFVFRSGDARFEGRSAEAALQAALADAAILMVNRNAGSGTRVLIDSLLRGAKPPGYANQPRSHNAVAAAIAAVGLTGFERRPIGTLSGGQMQRLLFARVMLQDARLIVLDEPFNAIDAKTCADLLALVKRWHGEGRTVLAALHDLEMVRAHFPDTLLLARGPVAWGPTAHVLTPDNLLVAMRMCEAFDDAAAACAVDAPSRAA